VTKSPIETRKGNLTYFEALYIGLARKVIEHTFVTFATYEIKLNTALSKSPTSSERHFLNFNNYLSLPY
jgi:hypothetical protein